MEKIVRTRFAPSPTGFLHIGGLRTALYTFLYAKQRNGKFVLRVEDTDQKRFVPGATEIIYRTLRDTGLVYDEGPDVGGAYGPYTQSERKDLYKKYAHELVERGGAYYCFCSKERLESLSQGEAHRYDKHCLKLPKEEIQKRLAAGEPYVIRQNMPTEGVSRYTDLVFGEIVVEHKELEDQVLLKSDGMPTYNFANVVDDHLMGITHIMRGTEYLSSTPKYNLLYKGFGWDAPEYIHMQPIMRDATHKLSKRDADSSYEDLVREGYLKEAIINYIALLGWSPKENREKFSLQELIQMFSINGLSKSPSIFDDAKLRWLNAQYIKETEPEKFYALALPFLQKSSVGSGKFDLRKIAKLIQPRIEVLSDIPEITRYLTEYGDFDTKLYEHQKMKTDAALAKTVLPEVLAALAAISEKDWNEQNIHDVLIALPEKLGLKNGQILFPARIAITAKETTPGGATENADVLGREETLRRLGKSIERLK